MLDFLLQPVLPAIQVTTTDAGTLDDQRSGPSSFHLVLQTLPYGLASLLERLAAAGVAYDRLPGEA